MPTYDYLCEKCGFEFEREQRITEDPVKTCPKCKARKVKRLLSAAGFILKGGGWYADGYGSAPSSQSRSGGDGGGSGSESGGSEGSGSSSSDSSSDGSGESGGKKKKGAQGGKSKSSQSAA